MYKVTIDVEKCDACESCVDICPVSVLAIVDGKAFPENEPDCEGCESCVEACPNSLITVTEI